MEDKKVYDGLKFTVKMESKDMVNFVLYHTYSNISGWIGVVISIVAIILLIARFYTYENSTRIVLLIVGLLFTVVNPLMLCYKAQKQVKSNAMFHIPVEYTMTDEFLAIEQGHEQLEVPWENIRLVKDTGRSLIVYVTKIRAFVWPKKQLDAQYEQAAALLVEKIGSAKVHIKNKK